MKKKLTKYLRKKKQENIVAAHRSSFVEFGVAVAKSSFVFIFLVFFFEEPTGVLRLVSALQFIFFTVTVAEI